APPPLRPVPLPRPEHRIATSFAPPSAFLPALPLRPHLRLSPTGFRFLAAAAMKFGKTAKGRATNAANRFSDATVGAGGGTAAYTDQPGSRGFVIGTSYKGGNSHAESENDSRPACGDRTRSRAVHGLGSSGGTGHHHVLFPGRRTTIATRRTMDFRI